ncbi:aldo/keto reductase [Plantactinospora sp. KBS50]|uniref:aldo/keto reductase n=1 Tax=Plantactinospora sp. KBS50 TaxID=2024580 RepID=UPI000BAAD22B|nr:aldo/keto reductase [Plantactinospora sp. KBS50]ASW54607.1 aldo/keto reductase [Plantactinospora sp. KBS50]
MQLRRLGSSGPVTSAIGLGTLGLTGGYGPVDRDEAVRTLWHALDAGVTLLDTADFYGGGAVESLVGTAIKDRRDDVVVATRGGALFTPEGRPLGVDGSPDRLRQACDASLERLGIDHIDLYYLARVDPKVPVQESVGALAELVAAGKVRHIGLSEANAEQLRQAVAVHPVAALASEYSLFEREVERTLLPVARELGVGLVACSPLGRGLLTGRLTSVDQLGDRDYRRNHPRFWPEHFAHNRELVSRAEALAAERDVSVGRLVLAWLLAQGQDIVPIPGTRCTTHLEMNVAATQVKLTEDELRLLAETIPADEVSGDRNPRR